MNKSNFKNILIAVVIIALIFAVSGWFYFKYKKQSEMQSTPELQKIKDQLSQLNALRQQYNLQPLTQEQAREQLKSLEQLYQKHNSKSLTQDQMKQQLETLQK